MLHVTCYMLHVKCYMLLVYAISCWYDACDKKKKKKNKNKKLQRSITKFYDKVCKITDVSVHESIEQLSNVHITRCKSLITKIVNDHDHSMHEYITVLPQGNLRVVKGRTELLSTTFLPVAIKLYSVK